MSTVPSSVEPLNRAQCMQLLHETAVGRVVFTAGALPVIQPTRYLVRGEAIVIQADAGSALARAGCKQVVAFEIDDIDAITGSGWSVVVTGHAVHPEGDADPTVTRHFGAAGGQLISIRCELVRGRRAMHPAPPGDRCTMHPAPPGDRKTQRLRSRSEPGPV